MFEQLRKAIEAASGIAEVPRRRAEKIAHELTSGDAFGRSQISSLAEEIIKRSKENAEMARSLISSEVRRQVRALGLATSSDIERLSRKIERLETRLAAPRATPKPKAKPKPK